MKQERLCTQRHSRSCYFSRKTISVLRIYMSLGGNRQVVSHGIVGARLGSSRSLSNSSQTLPASSFFYSDRRGRSRLRIYSFVDNWHYIKSAASGYDHVYRHLIHERDKYLREALG